jgi:NhaP-type Na+/H+ or K+/H+ antiporter
LASNAEGYDTKCGAEVATYEIATFTSGVVVAAINMAATIATHPVPTYTLSVLAKWATFTVTFLIATCRVSTFASLAHRTRTPNWRDGPRVRIIVSFSGPTGVVTIAIAHLVHLDVLLFSYRESNPVNRQTRWVDVACNTHFDSEFIR